MSILQVRKTLQATITFLLTAIRIEQEVAELSGFYSVRVILKLNIRTEYLFNICSCDFDNFMTNV